MFNIWDALALQGHKNRQIIVSVGGSKLLEFLNQFKDTNFWINNFPTKSQIDDYKLKLALFKGDINIFKSNIIYHYNMPLVLKHNNIKMPKYLIREIINLSGNQFSYKN